MTGAASDNGRAITRTFAERGVDIVVTDIREEPALGGTPTHERIEAGTSARTTYVECDATRREEVEAAVEAASA